MTARWPALLLFGALGALWPPLARIAVAALPSAGAQHTLLAWGFAVAAGAVLFALRPAWHGPEAAARVHARAGAAGLIAAVPCAVAWVAALSATDRLPAALVALAFWPPLTAAACAAGAGLCARAARRAALAATWLSAAGAGAAFAWLALPAMDAIGLIHAPEQAAAPSGMRSLRAAAGRLGLTLAPRYDGWDAVGRTQTFELGTALGVLVHDGAPVAPMLFGRAEALVPELCERTLLGEPLRSAPHRRVLLAGAGGGLELRCALWRGAQRVDVVDPSAARLEALEYSLGDFEDQDRRVHYHRADARAWAARRRGRYDLVVLPHARGKHVWPSGLLPLPSPALETDAGLGALLSALNDGGLLWTWLRGEPATLRFAITAEHALHALGARAGNLHVAVHRAGDGYAVAVYRSALEVSAILDLHERAGQKQPEVAAPHALERVLRLPLARPELVYTPGSIYENRFGDLFAAAGRPASAAQRAKYAFDLAPPTDDRPLVAELTRRDRPDTWSSASAYLALPTWLAMALSGALALSSLVTIRLRRPVRAALAGGLALAGLAAGHVLLFAFAQSALERLLPRPEQGFALAALMLPGFAALTLPFRLQPAALPWALAVFASFAAAALPLAPLLVSFAGQQAVAIAAALLLAAPMAGSWLALRRRRSLALGAAIALLATGCADGRAIEMPPPAPPRAGDTVVILPDTQFYACAYPHIFESQTRWIAEQAEAQGIALVLHTGDIVDTAVDAQWRVAADSMAELHGVVPYLVTAGNHDLLLQDRSSPIGTFFDPAQLTRYEWDAESRDPERPDNSYGIVELAGRSWLFLGLEFGPRDDVVRWAADVLSAYADLPAVLFTHAYLYSDGTRYDRAAPAAQPFHPDLYAFTPEQGIADGEDLWRELVEPHENVRLVVSGHVVPDGVARAVAQRASGSTVHELLANYQTCELCPCAEVEGGGGYLRLLRFAADGGSIQVETYSPHLDHFLTDEENQFSLAL